MAERITEIAWLQNGETLPAGWRFGDSDEKRCHHNHYARLIVREVAPTEQEAANG